MLDVAELDRLAGEIETEEQDRSVRHARQLTRLLALSRVYADAGMALSTGAHIALLMSCSENRAGQLLHEARVLRDLGALTSMLDGLLTVEQGRVLVDLLGPVDDAFAAALWDRLADRLRADRAEGIVRAPARLRDLLNRWLLAADPDGCAERRKDAAAHDADVELWKRGDGLVDIVGRALTPADSMACNDRIALLSQPTGPDDTRTEGQRRLAAYVDLILGRVTLPFDETTGEVCCPQGSGAPCGAQVFVHVPIARQPVKARSLLSLWGTARSTPSCWPRCCRAHQRCEGCGSTLTPVFRSPSTIRCALGPPRPGVLTRPHLADPGGYVAPGRLKQLVRVRAPRCEWPGCGRRASRAAGSPCDLDHDLAWPFGPTCACNLGPLCRRHHQIKQQGWGKQRQPDGSVRWTDPTGRTWTSPNQHHRPQPSAPQPARRQIAPGVWSLAA
jgi:hypothetical protein